MQIIDNCTIVDSEGTIENACIQVEGERITYAGPADKAPSTEGHRVFGHIDAGHRIAMPGLINTHCHTPMVLFRGAADDMPLQEWLEQRIWPLEGKLDAEAMYRGSMLAIAEMIRGGTTAFNDMYYMTENTVRAVEETGVSALLTHCLTLNSDDIAAVAGEIKKGVSFYVNYNGAAGGRVQATLSPHAEYTCSPALLQTMAEAAKKLGARIHTHISETRREHEECIARHGKTPIQLLESVGLLDSPTMCAHCVHISEGDMDIMHRKGASVLHCPGSNLKLGSGIADVPGMLAHGVNIALGTDGAASNNNLSMFEEMQMAAILHKATSYNAEMVRAAEALSMATANGARAFGWETGSLRAGMLADIVLVDNRQPHMHPMNDPLNQIIYSAQFTDVYMTMARGRVLYKDGEYYTLDIDKVLREADETARKIVFGE